MYRLAQSQRQMSQNISKAREKVMFEKVCLYFNNPFNANSKNCRDACAWYRIIY